MIKKMVIIRSIIAKSHMCQHVLSIYIYIYTQSVYIHVYKCMVNPRITSRLANIDTIYTAYEPISGKIGDVLKNISI